MLTDTQEFDAFYRGTRHRVVAALYALTGDLVAEIWFHKDVTEDQAHRIARKAAQRLCAATPAC